MMVGEVDYEDLFYSEERLRDPIIFPLTAHLLFGAFVLIMTIVLMNLLVGLAVSDIQGLQKGAKLDRLSRQTALIARFESFIFSKKLQAILPSSLILLLQNNSLLTSVDNSTTTTHNQLSFHFRPNDPRDHSLPKNIKKSALRLVSLSTVSKHSNCSSEHDSRLFEKNEPPHHVIPVKKVKRSLSSSSHRYQRRCDYLENNGVSNHQYTPSENLSCSSNPHQKVLVDGDRLKILEAKVEQTEKGIEKILQLLLRSKLQSDSYQTFDENNKATDTRPNV